MIAASVIALLASGQARTRPSARSLRLLVVAALAFATVICMMSSSVEAAVETGDEILIIDRGSRDQLRDFARSSARAPRRWLRVAVHTQRGWFRMRVL